MRRVVVLEEAAEDIEAARDFYDSIEQGVGVRAVSGEKTGFAYSDDIRADALLESASAARAISRSGGQAAGGQRVLVRGRELYAPVDPIDGMATDEKVIRVTAQGLPDGER